MSLYILALGPSALALLAVGLVALRARTRPKFEVPALYLIFSSGKVKSAPEQADKKL